MTSRVRAIVERLLENATPGDRLWPKGKDWLRNAWDRAREALGLSQDKQFVIHACRHTCASRLVQKGVNLRVVQEWLGHKTIQMTMRYSHLSPANLQEAAIVLEAAE